QRRGRARGTGRALPPPVGRLQAPAHVPSGGRASPGTVRQAEPAGVARAVLAGPRAGLAGRGMLADPGTHPPGGPHPELARRRRDAPVAWVEEPELRCHSESGGAQVRRGSGYWAVTRHATVVAAARDPARFSSAAKGAFLVDPKTPGDLERA